jgi:hypothetical protein
MLAWSDEDVRQLNENHWRERPTICPVCRGIVEVRDSGEIRAVPLMMAWCPRCHRSAQFPAAKAQGCNFTAAQANRMVGLHLLGLPALCPHDGATLVVQDIGIRGASHFSLRCPRCGASVEVQRQP